MSIALMHHLKTQIRPIQHIGPSANHIALGINNGMVEIKAIQIKRHGADAHCRKPNAHNRPCT